MNSIFRFDFRHFRCDLFGGLTAGIVALPLALAMSLPLKMRVFGLIKIIGNGRLTLM